MVIRSFFSVIFLYITMRPLFPLRQQIMFVLLTEPVFEINFHSANTHILFQNQMSSKRDCGQQWRSVTLNKSPRSLPVFPPPKPQASLPIKAVLPAQHLGEHTEGFVSSHLSQYLLCVTAATALMQYRRHNTLWFQFPALEPLH